jgi:hypothetical protein
MTAERAREINGNCKWFESHGAGGSYLGAGMLYYSVPYSLEARRCVCLGSGGGFVPAMMAEAQRDLVALGRIAKVDVNTGLHTTHWASVCELPDWRGERFDNAGGGQVRDLEKAVSFCLFNDIPKYTVGLFKNLDLAEVWYPDWTVVVYHDGTVPQEVLDELKGRGVRLIKADQFAPMFARFLVNDIAKRWVVRDADSRISERELVAVNIWIESGKMWHTMSDDRAHVRPVQGAMWGGYDTDVNMEEELTRFGSADNEAWGADEDFLCDVMWPRMKPNTYVHHYRDNPIPFHRGNPRYVGMAYTETERPL